MTTPEVSATTESVVWIFLPAAAALVFGLLTLLVRPGARLTSAMQHLAAGLIVSAVAVELLPESMGKGQSISYAVVGYIVGLVIVFGIRMASKRLDEDSSAGFVATIGLDLALDAILVGIAFTTLAGLGAFVVVGSLSLEIAVLMMATAGTLLTRGSSRGRVVLITVLLSAVAAIAGLAGFYGSAQLPANMLTATTALGVAALLYLVVEELLVEAHKREGETMIGSLMFFVGFGVPAFLSASGAG